MVGMPVSTVHVFGIESYSFVESVSVVIEEVMILKL